jgi:hypothetical protein
MARESKVGYITLQNFRFGLDARRSELTSQPGTLLRCVDCHINQGAEIEKRKAFVKYSLPNNTFGLLATTSGLLTFGSVAPGIIGILSAPFIYQQLISPLGSAMTAVVSATWFNGVAFVVATFGADGTYCFYNGALVTDFTNGLVGATTTLSALASNFVTLVNNTTYYTATQYPTSSGTYVEVVGDNNSAYTATATVVSTAGKLAVQQLNSPAPNTIGQQAIGGFTIFAATGGQISEIVTSTGTNNALLLNSGTINFDTDEATTAKDVAVNINTNVNQLLNADNVLTYSRAANVSTLTFSTDLTPFFTVGATLVVGGCDDATFNGTFSITAVNDAQVSYGNTGSNITSTATTTIYIITKGLFCSAIASGGSVKIYAPTGVVMNGWDLEIIGSGPICFCDFSFTFAVTSTAAFTVAALGTYNGSIITTNYILGAAVTYAGSLNILVATIANTINTTMGSSNIYAVAKGNILWVGSTETGSGPYGVPTTTLAIELATGATGVNITCNGNATNGLGAVASPKTVSSSTIATCGASGGTPPYSYQWFIQPSATLSASPLTPTSSSTEFAYLPIQTAATLGYNLSCTAYCIVTDSANKTATSNNINLNFNSGVLAGVIVRNHTPL